MDIINSSLATGLKAYWELEETSGTRADSFGACDLTDNNTVLYAAGKQGNAADFEATNTEYFTVADNAAVRVDDGWSVSMWVKVESYPAGGVGFPMYFAGIRSGENGWGVGFMTEAGPTYKFCAWAGAGSFGHVSSSQEVSLDTWYHIVVYFNGTNTKMYVNAGSVLTLTGLSAITNPNSGLRIGVKGNSDANYYDGILDEFGIWNRELTSSDVASLYNSGNGIPYEDSATIITPSAQVATFTVPAYTAKHGSTLTPSTQVDTFSVPTYAIKLGCTVSPSAQVATFSIPTYNVVIAGVSVSPSTQALTFSLPTYAVSTYVLAMPNGQTLTFTLPAYTLAVEANITLSPNTLVLTFTLPNRTKVGAVWVKRGRSTNATWVKSTRNSN